MTALLAAAGWQSPLFLFLNRSNNLSGKKKKGEEKELEVVPR